MSTLRAPAFPRRLLFTAVALWAVALAGGSALAQQFALRIVHTNDVHGRLLPFPYTFGGEKAPALVGGTARRITLARRLLKQAPGSSILVDCGDAFTRGPLATTYMGQAEAAAMNAAGYQLGVVGNNEFKARDAADAEDAPGAQAALTRFVAASRFPWLCANATDGAGKPVAGAVPCVMLAEGLSIKAAGARLRALREQMIVRHLPAKRAGESGLALVFFFVVAVIVAVGQDVLSGSLLPGVAFRAVATSAAILAAAVPICAVLCAVDGIATNLVYFRLRKVARESMRDALAALKTRLEADTD